MASTCATSIQHAACRAAPILLGLLAAWLTRGFASSLRQAPRPATRPVLRLQRGIPLWPMRRDRSVCSARNKRAEIDSADPRDFVCHIGGRRRDGGLRPLKIYKLQNVRSNSRSDSQTCGRPSAPRLVKRIFSAYLFALISGTQSALSCSRMRTICARRPPSIC